MGNQSGRVQAPDAEAEAGVEAADGREAASHLTSQLSWSSLGEKPTGGGSDLEAMGIKVKTIAFNVVPEDTHRASHPAGTWATRQPGGRTSPAGTAAIGPSGADATAAPGVSLNPLTWPQIDSLRASFTDPAAAAPADGGSRAGAVSPEMELHAELDDLAAAAEAEHQEHKRKASRANWGSRFGERLGSFQGANERAGGEAAAGERGVGTAAKQQRWSSPPPDAVSSDGESAFGFAGDDSDWSDAESANGFGFAGSGNTSDDWSDDD